MKNFFANNNISVKADVERHRAKEKELTLKIEQLEADLLADPTDKFATVALRTYRHLLCQLLDSKVNAVSKIGK
jgi:hypothetical protein